MGGDNRVKLWIVAESAGNTWIIFVCGTVGWMCLNQIWLQTMAKTSGFAGQTLNTCMVCAYCSGEGHEILTVTRSVGIK